jgi:hypothetical protein
MLLKVALNTINPNAGIKPMLMVIINTLARPGSILSCPLLFLDQVKGNGKDKILPGPARAMERKKYYLV